MSGQALLFCAVAALGFGGWPLIVRYAGVSQVWIAPLVCVSTSVLPILMLIREGAVRNIPPAKAFFIVGLAGLLNGVAMLAYGKIVGTPAWNLSITVPMTVGLMLIVPVIGGLLSGEVITLRQTAGIGLMLVAIWLLK